MKGQVIAGELGKVIIRQKSGEPIRMGELLIADGPENEKILMQVYDLLYGSQISQQNLELISGMHMEDQSSFDFADPALRNYILAFAKPILSIRGSEAALCKSLPNFFSTVREIAKEDVKFITKPENALYAGKLRSGSSTLDVDVYLPGDKVLSHHILIPATTGRGKSNLTSVMLWDCIAKRYCGILVLDPHDEYYGRTGLGLKDHPEARNGVTYYTSQSPPPGAKSLVINLSDIRPNHFEGAVSWTDAQHQAIYAAYHRFGKNWIEKIISDEQPEGMDLFQEGTLSVVKRKLTGLLGIQQTEKTIVCKSIFDSSSGTTTINDICTELESGKIVIIDTSAFSGSAEILIGSVITSELLRRYRLYKQSGELESKPVVSVLLEEAPRVIGNDVLKQHSNIFDTIAREGRKFKIGLIAITQLPSAIPRSILANMNTKIILGLEMKPERDAIIDSASQDLSTDSRNIASLDKGEAIITSNFTRFAIPIKIPLFADVAKASKINTKQQPTQRAYSGINL